MHAAATADQGPDRISDGTLHGALRIAGLTFALPIEQVREVTPCPPSYLPMPSTAPGVIGAMTLREELIPVIDLASTLGLSASGTSAAIAVVRHGDTLMGLLIDGIGGMLRIDPSHLSTITTLADGGCDLRGFATRDHSGWLLDLAPLIDRWQLPSTRERPVGTVTLATDPRNLALLFSLAQWRFAIPAVAIDAALPARPLLPSPVDDPLWLGFIEHKGERIALIDALYLFNLGRTDRCAAHAAVVVRLPNQSLVALAIDAVDDLRRVALSQIAPLGARVAGGACHLSGILRMAQSYVLIDADALCADTRVTGIARLGGGAASTVDAPGTPASESRAPYLIVRLGKARYAIPLNCIREILPMPNAYLTIGDGEDGRIGTFINREVALPLLDPTTRLGLPGDADSGRNFVVIVAVDGGSSGYVVQELVAVEHAARQHLPGRSDLGELSHLAETIATPSGAIPILDPAQIEPSPQRQRP